jgi:uncharacterized protein (TIGR00255 family)
MIRSMTGFGAASHEGRQVSVTVELRSVNSRHLKLNFRLPFGAEAWEAPLRAQLAEGLQRGQVDVSVRVDERAEGAGVELDESRVEAYVSALRAMQERYDLPGEIDLALMTAFGPLVREVRADVTERVEGAELSAAAGDALVELIAMREAEGTRLETELRARIAAIRVGLERVAPHIPARLERERERLRAAVAELTGGVQLDEERVAREIAMIADRWDVGEEMVRAAAHLDAFLEMLEAPAEEPVGKRLSFLIQELHREINTLGAKANDVQITREVVEMKNELEKLREQVENVE